MTKSPFRRLRESRGVTQLQVARLLGVSQSLISKMETGRAKPTGDLARLLSILGVLDAQIDFALYWAGERGKMKVNVWRVRVGREKTKAIGCREREPIAKYNEK